MRLNTYKWYLWKCVCLLIWLGCSSRADTGEIKTLLYLRQGDHPRTSGNSSSVFPPLSPDIPDVVTKPTVPSPTNAPVDSESSKLTMEIARRLENRLKYIRNEELCVPEIQEKFDSMDFVTRPRNDEEQLKKMASKLEGKLKRALSSVDSLELIAYSTANKLALKTETVVYPCPSRIPKVRRMLPISYNRDQIEIVNNNAAPPAVIIEEDFGSQFYKQLKGLQYSRSSAGQQGGSSSSSNGLSATPLNFKRQYLLSPHDNAIDNSCPFYFDTRSLR